MSDLIHYEDLPVGTVIDCGARHVSREEIIAFAEEFDPQPHHLDDAAANASMLKGLSASGWHTCAIMMKLMAENLAVKSASMGSPGIEEMRWMRPVRPGDTISLKGTVLSARVSKSRPEMGLVEIDWNISSEREQVASMRAIGLYGVRHPGKTR
ncbi:MAG: MaoC family dehydratase [Alphaproteobacteria bacterium]|nr:MaoC family dehydratase [Alphaproteobacteria bacterium]